jgi:hypothetical protein
MVGSIRESGLVCRHRSEHPMLRDEEPNWRWSPGDDVISSKCRIIEGQYFPTEYVVGVQ